MHERFFYVLQETHHNLQFTISHKEIAICS